MNNKQIEEAVRLLTEMKDEWKGITVWEYKHEIETLLSLAQLFLSVKEKIPKKILEDLITDIQGIDWSVDNAMSFQDNLIERAIDEFTAWLVGRVEKIIDIFPEFFHTIIIKGENEPDIPHQQVIFKKDVPEIITAIKTMIMEEKNDP